MRKNIAKLLNANESEIIFTSCATESNNMFLKAFVKKNTKAILATIGILLILCAVVLILLNIPVLFTQLSNVSYGLHNPSSFGSYALMNNHQVRALPQVKVN